ncbi:hypothetical protein QUA24_13975 [Microcoleus sp. Pol12B5]
MVGLYFAIVLTVFRIWHLYRYSAGGANENLIALGGITTIRSHLGGLPQFDRTWGDYHNSIALGGITTIRSPNLHLSARIRLITIRSPTLHSRFRWLKPSLNKQSLQGMGNTLDKIAITVFG